MSQAAADWLIKRLKLKPSSLLCLATGATPMRAYEIFVSRTKEQPAICEELRVIKLDEWGGIELARPATCESFLRRVVIDPLQLSSRYEAFQSQPTDIPSECSRIEQWLRANGPIDICVLGLGLNGHLGFNEPASMLHAHAHRAELSETSLTHSMIQSEPVKPTFGLTLGMADLMQSKEILLLVSGKAKREPLRQILEGGITTQFPATFLNLHPNVTLLCDEEAGQGVVHTEDYDQE